jgi:hypothetical protein
LEDPGKLFVFDLAKDAPPHLSKHRARADASDHVRAIMPTALVEHLNEVLRQVQQGGVKAGGESALGAGLLHHLVLAWSELSERSFSRVFPRRFPGYLAWPDRYALLSGRQARF